MQRVEFDTREQRVERELQRGADGPLGGRASVVCALPALTIDGHDFDD
jgi:hypothetical protein